MAFSLFEEPAVNGESGQSAHSAQPGQPEYEDDASSTPCTSSVTALSLVEEVAASYRRGLEAATAALSSLSTSLGDQYGQGFDPFEEARRKLPSTNELHQMLFKTIVRKAKETGLASPGVYAFDRDFDEFISGQERYGGFSRHDMVTVDIDGLCNALFNAYGGDAGKKVEHKRVAIALIRKFQLKDQVIQVKAGIVELKCHCYLENRYKGGYEFSYSSSNEFRNVLDHFAHVFETNGMNFQMDSFRSAISDHTFRPEPNKTTFVGKIDEFPMVVKVFKTELRWKFTEQCIAVLSDFVTGYGTED